MNIGLSFGECLTMFLDRFGISGSKLARALNVDPSLVNKWMHNKRAVPHNSNYIEQIADYICKCAPSDIVEEAFSDIIVMFNMKISKFEKQMCYRVIVEALSSAQKTVSFAEQNKYGSIPYDITRMSALKSSDSNPAIHLGLKARIAEGKLSGICTTIEGFDNIMDTALLLLGEALRKSPTENKPIMITSFTDMELSYRGREYRPDFFVLIKELLRKGRTMVRLYRLNDNLNRNMKISTEINCLLKYDKFMPHYFNSFNTSSKTGEMLIIPEIGALWGFSSTAGSALDRALLIRNNEAVSFLELWYSSLLINASSFVKKVSCCSIEDILKLDMEYGERYANKYCISYLPYILTIPYDIMMKYTLNENHKDKVRQYHKSNMEKFYNEINHFTFYCMCSKQALEHLIACGEYIYNDIRFMVETQDVIAYLESLVYIMETYDNFQIIFLNNSQINSISDASICIRENDCVRINYGHRDNNREMIHSYYINESTIVDAFRSNFLDAWNNFSRVKKDKGIMVSWINSQIHMLKRVPARGITSLPDNLLQIKC